MVTNYPDWETLGILTDGEGPPQHQGPSPALPFEMYDLSNFRPQFQAIEDGILNIFYFSVLILETSLSFFVVKRFTPMGPTFTLPCP